MKTKIEKPETMTYGERFVWNFILMSVIKNLPKIGIKVLTKSDSVPYIINESLLLKTTGVAAMSGCTTTDTMVHNAANLLQTMYTGSKLIPALYSNSAVNTQKNIVIVLYNKVILFMKGAANDLAIQAGDITAGNTMVIGCGASLSKKTTSSQPDFAVTASGPNWVQVHAKKAIKGVEGHIFICAIVPAKGTVPAESACKYYVTLECNVVINDLPSGSILAINHSGIIPVGHTKTPVPITPLKAKKVTKTPASKKKHPTFSYTSPDPYTWDGWIYVVIQ
jgi:hypothetical protein